MSWVEMDILDLKFSNEEFDLVIDKGEPRFSSQNSIFNILLTYLVRHDGVSFFKTQEIITGIGQLKGV